MGLKLRLQWFDRKTELGVGCEYSKDFGDDDTIMVDELGIPTKDNVNNGEFDLQPNWIKVLQPYFQHIIIQYEYHYTVAFDYQDE